MATELVNEWKAESKRRLDAWEDAERRRQATIAREKSAWDDEKRRAAQKKLAAEEAKKKAEEQAHEAAQVHGLSFVAKAGNLIVPDRGEFGVRRVSARFRLRCATITYLLQQDFADEGDIFTTRETQRFIRITYARQIERRGVSRHQHNLQDAHGHVPQFDNEER